jgi:hypothetical protein
MANERTQSVASAERTTRVVGMPALISALRGLYPPLDAVTTTSCFRPVTLTTVVSAAAGVPDIVSRILLAASGEPASSRPIA